MVSGSSLSNKVVLIASLTDFRSLFRDYLSSSLVLGMGQSCFQNCLRIVNQITDNSSFEIIQDGAGDLDGPDVPALWEPLLNSTADPTLVRQ